MSEGLWEVDITMHGDASLAYDVFLHVVTTHPHLYAVKDKYDIKVSDGEVNVPEAEYWELRLNAA